MQALTDERACVRMTGKFTHTFTGAGDYYFISAVSQSVRLCVGQQCTVTQDWILSPICRGAHVHVRVP